MNNEQIAQNKEEKYALIHFPQNLQRRNDILHTPITLQHKPIICTNEILYINHP